MKNVYKSIITFILITIILLLHLNCSTDKNSISSQLTNNFEIYFLADSDLAIKDVENMPIESIKILNTTVATANDIEYYKIFNHSKTLLLAHAIKFKFNMKEKFGTKNCPFLLMASGERIYIGEYWANFMSTIGPDIVIYPYLDSEFHILSSEEGREKINDNRIIDALTNAGIDVVYADLGNN